ncbi:MAG: EAL domain-containing protein [Clostridia bacterium]|nr:EAL domain-containing protein [Clostridia bacterium]
MNILSLLAFLSSIMFLYLGIYIISMDYKSRLNRTFFALYLCFAIWGFSFVFAIPAATKEICWFWYKIAALGFCSVPSCTLHFFMALTKKDKILSKWWIYVLIYLPAAIFIYKAQTGILVDEDFIRKSYGWAKVQVTNYLWLGLYVAYYFVYAVIGLVLCYRWKNRTNIPREKKQAVIILVSAAVALGSGSLTDIILPFFKFDFPNLMSPITALAWTFGMWYAIVKYRLMVLTPSLAVDNILKTMVDSVILVSPEGKILSVNLETEKMLGYRENELAGATLDTLFKDDNLFKENSYIKQLEKEPIRNYETLYTTKDGRNIPVVFSASETRDDDGNLIGVVAISRDITELKSSEEQLTHLANHDFLTNLPNRILFHDRLKQAMVWANHHGYISAVVLLDLDRFKEVNDVLGHDSGDILLKEVAVRLRTVVLETDTIARLGGDEFIIIVNEMNSQDEIKKVAKRILEAFKEPFIVGVHKLYVTCSIGISLYPQDGNSIEILIKNADLAMYCVKSQGRNGYRLFTADMSNVISERMELENNLRKALERKEFVLYYQPIVDVVSGKVAGMEALVRWHHPELGIIPPAKFIPVAEDSGLILQIGEWALRRACQQNKEWHKEGLPKLKISVNLSPRQFQHPDIVEKITHILEDTGIDPKCLMLEITESMAMNDVKSTVHKLNKLHDLGILIAIDDFGTGYSSLSYLRNFPIYAIKIDKYFIKDMTNDPGNAAIVMTMIAMANSLNLKVIVEGIETEQQLEFLRTLKWDQRLSSLECAEIQGYLFSRPVRAEEFASLIGQQVLEESNFKILKGL